VDIHEMSVERFAHESEDNKLMQGHIWTKAYKMEEDIKNLEEECAGLRTIAKAMDTIKAEMIKDNPSERGSYAHSWHCNIAMACHDAILEFDSQVDFAHEVGNDAASRFMKLCFGVDTEK